MTRSAFSMSWWRKRMTGSARRSTGSPPTWADTPTLHHTITRRSSPERFDACQRERRGYVRHEGGAESHPRHVCEEWLSKTRYHTEPPEETDNSVQMRMMSPPNDRACSCPMCKACQRRFRLHDAGWTSKQFTSPGYPEEHTDLSESKKQKNGQFLALSWPAHSQKTAHPVSKVSQIRQRIPKW